MLSLEGEGVSSVKYLHMALKAMLRVEYLSSGCRMGGYLSEVSQGSE